MVKMFRGFSARVAVLMADESGMSTVEYSNVENYIPTTRRPPPRRFRQG